MELIVIELKDLVYEGVWDKFSKLSNYRLLILFVGLCNWWPKLVYMLISIKNLKKNIVVNWEKITFLRLYLFIFRGRGREGEREGEKHQCVISCLSLAPNWRPGPQLRHVTWLGIEPMTLCFTGLQSIHWAIPARARRISL